MAKKHDAKKPTILIQVLCIAALVIIVAIGAVTKTDIPLVVYAILAGILFGVGNIRTILGGKQ